MAARSSGNVAMNKSRYFEFIIYFTNELSHVCFSKFGKVHKSFSDFNEV